MLWLLAIIAVTGSHAIKISDSKLDVAMSEADLSRGNPIRKVVAMMEKMAERIAEEGTREAELFEKFECYCKKSMDELEKSIQQAEQSPVTQADIDSREAEVKALENEVAKLKADRIAEDEALKSAQTRRVTDHDAYEVDLKDDKREASTLTSAIAALNGSASPALLQSSTSNHEILKAVEQSQRLDASDKQSLTSFLEGAELDQPGGSDYVKGLLTPLLDDKEVEIDTEVKDEKTAEHNFEDMEVAKKTEIKTLLDNFERKLKRIGELKVSIVNMKNSMATAGKSLEDDKKMLADLDTSCSEKSAAWEERKAARTEEQIALKDTIKILNSDESLDLFRARGASGTGLLQTGTNSDKKKIDALKLLKSTSLLDSVHPELNFLALALSGKEVNFEKVIEKIDSLVDLLNKEGDDDISKKEYCNKAFQKKELEAKDLNRTVASLKASVAEKKQAVATLVSEINSLQAGVKNLDASVAQATENRKAEHDEFQELQASDSQALQLLSLARERLNKIYAPSLVKPTTTANPYSLSLLQQAPPTFKGDYKQQSSAGVLSMIDTLKKDIEKEMAVAKADEDNSQKEYETTTADASTKREADLALVTSKSLSKAELEADSSDDKSQVNAKETEFKAVDQFIAGLHKECDWLLANFEIRAEARVEEKENLIRAKTLLRNA